MQRIILQSVEIADQENGNREATVVLRVGGTDYAGTAARADGEDDLAAVALATLSALEQFLPFKVELQLGKAAIVQHESIGTNLLVVTLDYLNNGERTSLTGTCLSDDEGASQNIAKATLDATNRLIEYLLSLQEQGKLPQGSL